MNVSLIVPNYRDVGETINILTGRPVMQEGVLLRGGELGLVNDLALINNPRTIINLRKGPDPEFEGTTIVDCPAPNSVDVYLANSGANRIWILSVLAVLASPEFHPPFYIHCAAGKDRTGVVIAAVLSCIGIASDSIQQDYELSSGPLHPELFASETLGALRGGDYFRRVDCAAIKQRFTL